MGNEFESAKMRYFERLFNLREDVRVTKDGGIHVWNDVLDGN